MGLEDRPSLYPSARRARRTGLSHLWPTLARLACPALAVWGTESDALSEAQARRIVETLPKGEFCLTFYYNQ